MAWEEITKRVHGRSAFGAGWLKYPAVSINSNGLTFNAIFIDAFAVKIGTNLQVLIDKGQRRIGIKVCTDPGAAHDGLWPAREASKKGTALYIGCSAVSKAFADARGRAFRAHMNAGERVIEISLSSENRL